MRIDRHVAGPPSATALPSRGPPATAIAVDGRHGTGLSTAIGTIAVAGLTLAAFMLAIGAAGARRLFFIPASRHAFPDWLAGPLHGLGVAIAPRTGALLLVAMLAFYLCAFATAGALSPRVVWTAVVAAHLAMVLAPPMFSADVFAYAGYARLFVLHGIDPYLHGADAAPLDPVRPFVTWHGIATPYGALFTFVSLPLAWVSVPVALWTCKALAALGSLACVGLVGRIAAARGVNPATAVVFVGLNPLLLAYEVGGGHNDMLPVGLVLLAILLVMRERPAGAGASAVLAFGAKASAGLTLPFVLLASRPRRSALAGAAAAGAAVLVVSIATFSSNALSLTRQLRQQQDFVAHDSVPSRLASLLGYDHLPAGLRALIACAFAATVATLLWAVWRGRLDWIAGAGWATFALLLATAWLVEWYAVWLLPLAALSRSRPLLLATVAFCAYVIVTHVHWLLL
ncbi:MAG TPA: glycosyltransferase 87 family protein [Conexibacter sp.]|jgi:alpha-1,6-mannosyltransferase